MSFSFLHRCKLKTGRKSKISDLTRIRGNTSLHLQGPAEPIGPIGPGELKYTFQGPTYVQRDRLLKAKTLEDVLTIWRKSTAD
jgi:hypothetical protein